MNWSPKSLDDLQHSLRGVLSHPSKSIDVRVLMSQSPFGTTTHIPDVGGVLVSANDGLLDDHLVQVNASRRTAGLSALTPRVVDGMPPLNSDTM